MNKPLLAAIVAASLFGCAKKDQLIKEKPTAAAEQKPAEADQGGTLPGAADVRTAMAAKEYSSAVERLVALKMLAATSEQKSEYFTLFGDVRNQLNDASTTNQSAAEALMTLRSATLGR
ncbi:MAG TPA: hypothetical protein VGR78_03950 [Verrucomicrobiae bacterium]|nr:hypothetical protein [Verrucomicrobiae bacterium]